jgi:hypothetical protein
MMMNMRSNDLAVSESLGYILIFGVVMACIAVLFITGNQIIADNQKSVSFQSMTQNFNVIQSDLMTTASGSSPVMTTKMNINNGVLSLLPDTMSGSKIVTEFNGATDEVPMGKLIYQATNDQAIALEDGAIIMQYGFDGATGSIMSQQPKIYYSPKMGALMISTIDLTGEYSGISSSFVSLQLKSGDQPTLKIETSSSATGEPVVLSIRTDYTGAWMDFLTNIPGLKADVDTTVDPAQWVKVTLHDANHMLDPSDSEYNPSDIKKVIFVKYNIEAILG